MMGEKQKCLIEITLRDRDNQSRVGPMWSVP